MLYVAVVWGGNDADADTDEDDDCANCDAGGDGNDIYWLLPYGNDDDDDNDDVPAPPLTAPLTSFPFMKYPPDA